MDDDTKQEHFDSIISLALDAISSREYLEGLKIYVSDVLYDETLTAFVSDFNKGNIRPGLYPIANNVNLKDFSEWERKEILESLPNTVHWFVVVKRNDKLMALNGYPSSSPGDHVLVKSRSRGLNAQAEGSHGVCQSISLMSYLGEENILSKKRNKEARYEENLHIILGWLKKFTKKNDIYWSVKDIPLKKDTLVFFRAKQKNKSDKIFLSDLFNFIADESNKDLLLKWFREEEVLSDDEDEQMQLE